MLPRVIIDEIDGRNQQEPLYEQLYIDECYPEPLPQSNDDDDDEQHRVIVIEII